MVELVDTNLIVRYLVGDIPEQQKQVKVWFKEGENGKRKLVIKPLVIAETCFVLESFYEKSREEISRALEVLLSQKWLMVDERETMLSLWFFYKKNFHFVDSYLISWAKNNNGQVLSFDKKLIKATLNY